MRPCLQVISPSKEERGMGYVLGYALVGWGWVGVQIVLLLKMWTISVIKDSLPDSLSEYGKCNLELVKSDVQDFILHDDNN